MRLSPQSLARASSRRPWRTVGIWLAVMVAAGVATGSIGKDATTTDVTLTNNPEAKQAEKLLERLTGPEADTEMVIVSSEASTVDDPDFRGFVEGLTSALKALGPEVVVGATNFYETDDPGMVSDDRHIALIPTTVAGTPQQATDKIPDIKEAIAGNAADGFEVQVFGAGALGDDFTTVSEEDLKKGESVGVLAALVILVVVFGAVVAGLIPIIVGVASIFVAVGVVSVVGQLVQFSFFVTNMISMMGLAVGIDYSLFVVSRYREERARGRDKLAAIEATGATASRAVFFSGMTVVLALAGMILIPNSIFKSLGAGAIFVVIVAVLASLTLLPAVIGLLGDKVNAGRIRRRHKTPDPDARGGFWDAVTRGVMRRPVVSLVVGVAILLACASSALDMRTGFSGVSTLPEDLPSRQAFDVLAAEFSGGLSSPVKIVVDGPADGPAVTQGVERLLASLEADQAFGEAQTEVNDAKDLTLVSVPFKLDPSSKAAVQGVERVRDRYVPAAFPEGSGVKALVGGETAFNKDFFEITDRYLPIVFGFVLSLSFILLTLAFRSIVVPIKAILLNLLSVGAAYGLIVLVCQKGVGAGLFGFQQVEVIEAWLPLFLFSVLFGLSMDYHVFLLSRIREHFDQTNDNTESVAYGLRTTAGIITGAALIMVAVFGGFAAGRMVSFEQMGFGLGVAVLIDATIVRSILVPASMKLLGARNWYLPSWLEWLPNVAVEGPAAHLHDEPVDLGSSVPPSVRTGNGGTPAGEVPVGAGGAKDEG